MAYCPKCGASVDVEDKYCMKCGREILKKMVGSTAEPEPGMKKVKVPKPARKLEIPDLGPILLVVLIVALIVSVYFVYAGAQSYNSCAAERNKLQNEYNSLSGNCAVLNETYNSLASDYDSLKENYTSSLSKLTKKGSINLTASRVDSTNVRFTISNITGCSVVNNFTSFPTITNWYPDWTSSTNRFVGNWVLAGVKKGQRVVLMAMCNSEPLIVFDGVVP